MDIVKKYKLSTFPARAPQSWPGLIQKCSQDWYSEKVKSIYFTCALAPILSRFQTKMSAWIYSTNQNYLLHLRTRPICEQISYKHAVRVDAAKKWNYLMYPRARSNPNQISYKNAVRNWTVSTLERARCISCQIHCKRKLIADHSNHSPLCRRTCAFPDQMPYKHRSWQIEQNSWRYLHYWCARTRMKTR